MSGHTPFSLRSALTELPARPLNRRPKPTVTQTSPAEVPKENGFQPLTPPATPPKPGGLRTQVSTYGIETRSSVAVSGGEELFEGLESTADSREGQSTETRKLDLRLYHKYYQVLEELGRGVWSDVYLAREIPQPTTSAIFPPPPPTPPSSGPLPSQSKTLAVKMPSRRDAHQILEREARILTFLHSDDEAISYLVPFYGFDAVHRSLVLDAMPQNLEAYAKASRRLPFSTKTMFDPMVGAEQWAHMAEALISGLAFLHRKGCVHGDIKPANVLIRRDKENSTTPLYCDFSSSRIVAIVPPFEAEEVSAVTTDYTSPELLGSFHGSSNDRAVVSFASDVFALAVTLLFAAIGESPYACAHLDLQKLAMAKEGTPLEYARRGQQASRIMKGRAVERALKGGLSKDPEKRLPIEEWRAEVLKVSESWRDGGWSRGG